MTPFYRRRFLNRRGHHGGAYVLADVTVERHDWDGETRPPSVSAWVTVSDCSRTTQLDFTVDRAGDLANALHKARLLRDTLADFTAALEEAAEEVRGRLQR